MRLSLLLLALAGAILAAGCAHRLETTPPRPAASRPEPGPRLAPQRLLHVYVDCALPAESAERNRALAETIALTLRDELRRRGYDVRGAEPATRDSGAPGDAVAQLVSLARAVAMGAAPPAAARYASYLHPNSPRLSLFVALEPNAAGGPRRPAELEIGGFLADPSTGEILWSDRHSARIAADDRGIRRLAGELLKSFALVPPP